MGEYQDFLERSRVRRLAMLALREGSPGRRGLSAAAIGALYGLSRQRVAELLRNAGFVPRYKRHDGGFEN